MLQPKKYRWRKQHKGRIHGTAQAGASFELWSLWAQGSGARPTLGAAD